MSHEISTAEVVFRDLSDAFNELSAQNLSPRKVRTVFSNFLERAYRLTQMMYKEYRQKKGRAWEANSFQGWNSASELLKKLRRVDTHEHTVLIQVHERQYYRIDEDSPNYLVVEGTWTLADQHADAPPEGIRLVDADPKTEQLSEDVLLPEKREYEFYLYPVTEEIEAELTQIGDRNVHWNYPEEADNF